jgi:hypothetical protein
MTSGLVPAYCAASNRLIPAASQREIAVRRIAYGARYGRPAARTAGFQWLRRHACKSVGAHHHVRERRVRLSGAALASTAAPLPLPRREARAGSSRPFSRSHESHRRPRRAEHGARPVQGRRPPTATPATLRASRRSRKPRAGSPETSAAAGRRCPRPRSTNQTRQAHVASARDSEHPARHSLRRRRDQRRTSRFADRLCGRPTRWRYSLRVETIELDHATTPSLN